MTTTTTSTEMPTSTETTLAPDTTDVSDPTVAEPSSTSSSPAPPPTTAVDPAAPSSDCRRLDDFAADTGAWSIVNDGVMGGRSAGSVAIDSSVMRFDGTIVTDGGGFTSVRRRLDDGELAGTSSIRVRTRPDDRRYALILESDERIDGRSVSYRAELDVDSSDDDPIAEVVYDDLETSIFGFRVDAAPFDPAAAREIGIIISDGIDGDFVLDVESIDACS